MQVVITKDQLVASKACSVYFDSPEWNAEQQALVYADWNVTVERLLSDRAGTTYLDFLVSKNLVPMTREEFKEARRTRGGVHV
jgi:hypothetical protein